MRANLDPTFIYGIDRMMCRSFNDWAEFLISPSLQHENRIYVHPRPFDLGVRISSNDYKGYVPIGFFQMWHPKISNVLVYPDKHTSAGRGDMLFTLNWPRAKRAFIPEVIGYHLESEPGKMGVNWDGRASVRFGPALPS